MTVAEHIAAAPVERQAILTALHEVIIANDTSVIPVIKPMMGKEMILYEERCYMKYGLASTKNYLSFHCMPMYMNPALYAKFTALAPSAAFQKGCINFKNETELPAAVLAEIIQDCSAISVADMLEKRKKK